MDWNGDTVRFNWHEGKVTLTRSGKRNWSLTLDVTGGEVGLSSSTHQTAIASGSCLYVYTDAVHYKAGQLMNGQVHCILKDGKLRWQRQLNIARCYRGAPQVFDVVSGLLVLTQRYAFQGAARAGSEPIFDVLLLSRRNGKAKKKWPAFPRALNYNVKTAI